MEGIWTEEEYLKLSDHTGRLEYTSGRIEELPAPTIEHQLILKHLFRRLDAFVEERRLGIVLFSGTRVFLEPDKFRDPDIVFNFAAKHARSGRRYYKSADLVMEIVSDDPGSRIRDCEKKVIDYAAAGIAEYWIVDSETKQITVNALAGTSYETHGAFNEGELATSKLLTGFAVDVATVFAEGRV